MNIKGLLAGVLLFPLISCGNIAEGSGKIQILPYPYVEVERILGFETKGTLYKIVTNRETCYLYKSTAGVGLDCRSHTREERRKVKKFNRNLGDLKND